MNKLYALLCLLLLSQNGLAQPDFSKLPRRPLIPDFIPRIWVPHVDPANAGFAYLQQSGTQQRLQLARLTHAFLLPTAETVAQLATADGLAETILDLHAAPDNRWLAVYAFQDSGFGFVDHNLSFFDMQSGAALGLRNEHSFSSLNESILPSARLAEYKEYLRTEYDLSEESLAELDYQVVTEGANIATPFYGWNADGSFWISFELDVEAVYPEGYAEYIGTELFRMNVALAASGISTLDFGPARAPASFPPVFDLGPDDLPEDYVRFEGRAVRFRSYFYSIFLGRFVPFYEYPRAVMTEGNLPRRYRALR